MNKKTKIIIFSTIIILLILILIINLLQNPKKQIIKYSLHEGEYILYSNGMVGETELEVRF